MEALSRFGSGVHRHHHPRTAADQPATRKTGAERESDLRHKDSAVIATLDKDDSVDYHPHGTLTGVKSHGNTTMNEYEIDLD